MEIGNIGIGNNSTLAHQHSTDVSASVAWISKAEFLWRAKAERILLFPHLFSSFPNLGIVAEKDDRAHVMLRFFQHRRQSAVNMVTQPNLRPVSAFRRAETPV